MSTRVFAPVSIGPIELRDRLALAPVTTALGGTDGTVTARHVAHDRRRARGGVGLVIVEPLFVDRLGREHPRQLGAHADEMVPGLRKLAATIQREGVKACTHLNHGRCAANPRVIGGPPEAPLAVAARPRAPRRSR